MGNVGEYYVGKKLLKKIGSAQIGIKKNNIPHLQGLTTTRLQCGLMKKNLHNYLHEVLFGTADKAGSKRLAYLEKNGLINGDII